MGRKEWADAGQTHSDKVQKLMKIRADWKLADFEEWETGVAIPYENRVGVRFNVKTIPEWMRIMEQARFF